MTGPIPLRAAGAAVRHALAMVARGMYQLGTGDIDSNDDDSRDCFGFAVCECFGIKRHRPGFNRGSWATVSDDLNCNSALEDADHAGELFGRATQPQPGDLLAYPTITLTGHAPFIGHIGIVVDASAWDPAGPRWSSLVVVQCHGPNGLRPGIARTDGSVWDHHDALWPKPAHRTGLLRVRGVCP